MIDIIVLIFLVPYIGKLAISKGERSMQWKIRLIAAWMIAEFIGVFFGIMLFGFNMNDLTPLMLLGFISAIGGFLFVRAKLLKMPDNMDDDINRIGSDDLRP
ncbi:MAG: hypothetical protein ABI091_06060 [Ferruginibacter sp.]